jgi:nitroreductase
MDLATVDELLSTTRSVRRRLDLSRPVEPEVIERCLEVAIQAPTGGNIVRYHFVVVTEPEVKAALAELYRRAYFDLYLPQRASVRKTFPERDARLVGSASYLAERMHQVPVLVVPCIEGRPASAAPAQSAGTWGSILPAAWSFMLALRARGLGSAWTTLHLHFEAEAAALLGIPDEVMQAALLPVAYYTGESFRPAPRVPARERTYWNGWGCTAAD